MTTEIQANNWDFIPFVSTPYPLQALHILSEHQKANKVFEDAEFPLVAPAAFFYSQEQHTKAEQTTPGLSQKLTKASLTDLGLASVPIIQATGVSPSIEVQYDAARLHDFRDVLTAIDLVLKKDPTLINRLFTIRETNPQGVYCVWLYVNSVWQKVILDGNLPRRDNDIAIPHCKTELWLDFLVKALAKVHGKTFGRLPETCRFNPTEFLQNILGAIPEDVNLNEQRDNLWRILTGLIAKQNVALVGYRRGNPVPCLFTSFNPQTISLRAVNASGDFKVLGQRAQEQEVSINDLATQFERVVALHFSTMEYYSGVKKAQSNLTSTVAFRAKFSSESAVRVSVEQALAHPNGQLGNFGPLRVLVVRESPLNVEHIASAFTANTKGAQTSLRVTAGSYLVLVDIQRAHQGTNPQGQPVNAESNEFSVGLISDVKPDSFDRLCDIDVNQAIRGAIRSFVSKRTLQVQPEVLTSDRTVLQYQGFEGGYIYSVIANESPKKFISDFQIDTNSLNPGVQNISSGVDYKAETGIFSTGIRPGAQLLAVFKGIPKAAAQPGQPISFIKGNNQSMRFDNDTPPQAGAPVPEDFNSFVDPRVAGAVTDIEFDDKNVDNMVLRRYIYRNGNPQHRRWRGFDTGVVVYTLADANGLYILFDNKSPNKVLEERLNIESVNLKVANVKSALLMSDTTNNNNNFSIKIGPKQSSLVYLTTVSQNSYSYSITNHYRITSI